jgi:hypothetical protein
MSIDTTIAGSAADSYVTIQEADDYLQGRGGFDLAGWAALDGTKKEFQLKLGAKFVDSLNYRGVTATRNQALAFPRIFPRELLYVENSGVPMPFNDWDSLEEYADLRNINAPGIPEDVKFAQIEITFQVVYAHLMTLGPMDVGEREINSLSIDVISLSFASAGQGASPYGIFSKDKLGATAPVRLYLRKYMGTSAVLI